MSGIRERVASALHEGRDHTVDGTPLGSTPICNCYLLADKAIAALGGIRDVTQFGTVIPSGVDTPEVIMIDYKGPIQYTRDPHDYKREVLSYATPWAARATPEGQTP